MTSAPTSPVACRTASAKSSTVWSMTRSAPSSRQSSAFCSAYRGQDPGPEGHPELDRGGPETARAGVHQQRLPGPQLGPDHQRQVRRVERQQERCGLGVVELVGCCEDARGRRGRVLGDAAERVLGDGDDPLADPLLGARAGGLDDPADVHAEGEGRLLRDRDQPAPAAQDVVEVQGAGRDLDQHLAGCGLRHLDVVDAEHVARVAVLVHLQRSHRGSHQISFDPWTRN